MKEAVANEVVEGLKDAGVKFASFLPDSWLKPIYFRLTQDPHFMTILSPTKESELDSAAGRGWVV